MKRNLLRLVFASFLCLILASQVREVPPLPPMDAKRDKNIVDLKATCKEKEQIEKMAKLLEELQEHKASPCQRCTGSQQKH